MPQNSTVDDLRNAITTKGLTRRIDTLGEVWTREGLAVLVGANEIVMTLENPRVQRRFNRAAGGLDLAIEFLQSS